MSSKKLTGIGNVHIDVGRLSQHPTALQKQAKLPSGARTRTLAFVNDHRVQKTPATNGLDEWRINRADSSSELLAEIKGLLGQVLLNENIKGRHRNRAA